MSSRVNHLASAIAGVISRSSCLASLWYPSLRLFARKLYGDDGRRQARRRCGHRMMWPLIETFLLGWFLAYVIGTALSMRPDPNPAARGFGFGVFMGIGVYASMTLMGVVWGGLPFTAWAINAGFVVVAMAIMGWIIGAMSARTATDGLSSGRNIRPANFRGRPFHSSLERAHILAGNGTQHITVRNAEPSPSHPLGVGHFRRDSNSDLFTCDDKALSQLVRTGATCNRIANPRCENVAAIEKTKKARRLSRGPFSCTNADGVGPKR